jgi:hypothetical protein
MHHEEPARDEVPSIIDRDDAPEHWSSVWSLLLLGLLALMLLHACAHT